jgi:hypothetical protein
MMCGVGALVTLELTDDSPIRELPWIITFSPMNEDEEWDSLVCGPYEQEHALALAESVVTDEELMAVVEPMQPYVSIDQIRGDITAARLAAEDDGVAEDDGPVGGQLDPHFHDDEYVPANGQTPSFAERPPPPSPEEVRAGFGRIASLLIGA